MLCDKKRMQVCRSVMDGSEDGGLACSSRDVENVVGAIAAEFKIIVVDITSHSITASVCGAHWALESWVKNVLLGDADWLKSFRVKHLHCRRVGLAAQRHRTCPSG